MKKHSFLRILLCTWVLLLVLAPVLSMTAAADNSYSIPSADFDIVLMENGDAVVTETWILDYKSGDFTRFHKEIHTTDLYAYEQFSNVEFRNFYINGAQVYQTWDTSGRPSNTFALIGSSENIEMCWYLAVQAPGRAEYKCEYVLRDVVHELKDGNAVFSYRVVGAKFDDSIGVTTVTIHLPGASGQIADYSRLGTAEIGEDTVSFRTSSHSKLQKYIITMDRSLFDNVTVCKTEESAFAGESSSEGSGAVIGLSWFAAIGFFIFLMERRGRKLKAAEEKKKEEQRAAQEAFMQRLDKNPNHMAEVLQKLNERGISPMELGCTISKVPYSGSILMVGMLCQLVNEGYVQIEDDQILIANKVFPEKNEREFVNALASAFPYEEQGDVLRFNVQILADQLGALDKDNALFKTLDSLADRMARTIPADLKEACQDVESYFNVHGFRSDLNNVIQLAKENGEVDPLLLAGLFVGTTANCGTNEPLEKLAFLGVFIRDARIPKKSNSSSDSGCGGCSGCSGCSGCGGGGAD